MTARAGQRRRVIDVQEHNGNVEDGEPTYGRDEDWKTILEKIPVAYRGVTGGEVVRGRQMEADTTGLIEILFTPRTARINTKMRIRLDGRILNIESVIDEMGDKRELLIQVAEQT